MLEKDNTTVRSARDQIRRMFDKVAFRYDTVNRLLSLRRDTAWRRALCAAVPTQSPLRILDLATGTGDVPLAIYARLGDAATVVGADLSEAMLREARWKLQRQRPGASPLLAVSDAAALCFPDGVFDVVTAAFGVRNFTLLEAGLKEMRRVLRPGGCVLILEFSLPSWVFIRAPYLLYFRHILPRVAGWISRQPDAYRYLNQSVEAFPHGEAFLDILCAAGFRSVQATPLSCGIATLYKAQT